MKYWNLYWVESDGVEDCFVVARNSRSACRVECEENDFEIDEVNAIKIMRIPKSAERTHAKRENHSWPGYVFGKEFFEKLGAQFRTVEKKQEMLIDDTVYTVDEYRACSITKSRTIGEKASIELSKIPKSLFKIDHEDMWAESELEIFTFMGLCMVRCQQIEEHIASSFIFATSEKEKTKYKTIGDVVEGWKKHTLGKMFYIIDEAYEIEPTVKAAFKMFIQMRNRLIHDLAVSEQYNIRTDWGKKELVAFLALFDIISLSIKRAFRASFFASIDFGRIYLNKDGSIPENLLKLKQKKEMELFFHFFSPR
jgi:hypothetical protein